MDSELFSSIMMLVVLVSWIPKFWETAWAMVWAVVGGLLFGLIGLLGTLVWHTWSKPRLKRRLAAEERSHKEVFAKWGAFNAFNERFRPLESTMKALRPRRKLPSWGVFEPSEEGPRPAHWSDLSGFAGPAIPAPSNRRHGSEHDSTSWLIEQEKFFASFGTKGPRRSRG